MPRVILAAAAAALLAAGCMFPQSWHWPRTTNTPETIIYVAARYGLAAHHLPHVTWAASYYNGHPELAIRVVDVCPTGTNCINVRTTDLPYPVWGRTTVGTGSTPHLTMATLRVDPLVGTFGTTSSTRRIFFHEMCHALGGGFRDDIHHLCNWDYRDLIFREITRVYHPDT